MLSAEENDLMCRVGPGTPMGNLMRRYWLPFIPSKDLVADGEPVRIMLLGEKLIAFRDTQGRVGLMDHECPHRLASLFYGRNEEGGLRCIYHGWKFDVEGNCLDMANVPPHQDFKANVKAPAYKVQERGGLVWAYMGEASKAPPFPLLPQLDADPEKITFRITQTECNWVQVMEGLIDTSHAGFLHGGKVGPEGFQQDDASRFGYVNRTPEYEIAETDWGTMYGAFRPAEPGELYWRIAHFVFPFFALAPPIPFRVRSGITAMVPMDDTHTLSINMRSNWEEMRAVQTRAGLEDNMYPAFEYLPNTTDWFGRNRMIMNVRNDHMINREMQRTVNYSGIKGVGQQDQAVQESMGPIENRTKEHLASSDRMIVMTRRRLIDAAVALRDKGTPPPAVNDPTIYYKIESGNFTSKAQTLWDAYNEAMVDIETVDPRPVPVAAE